MKKLILILPLFVAGCATSQAIQLRASDEMNAKRYILERARDPASVTFGPMTGARVGDAYSVCVMVNGLNGYGGHTGYEPVYVQLPYGGYPVKIAEGDAAEISCKLSGAGLAAPGVDPEVLRKNGIPTPK